MLPVKFLQNWIQNSHLLWILVVGGLSASVCQTQANRQPPLTEDRLRFAVQSYLKNLPLGNLEPTSYIYAFVNLTGDGKRQAVVYLTGSGWCGSSGCTMLLLTLEGTSYKVLTRMPAVRLPIRVLEARSHEWHDLSVWIQGGGIVRGYEEVVKFDGKGYAEVSSKADEERPAPKLKGKIILSKRDREVPLYP